MHVCVVQEYQIMLTDRLAELRDIVKVKIRKAAESQTVEYKETIPPWGSGLAIHTNRL